MCSLCSLPKIVWGSSKYLLLQASTMANDERIAQMHYDGLQELREEWKA
jgi:hypothetical protein